MKKVIYQKDGTVTMIDSDDIIKDTLDSTFYSVNESSTSMSTVLSLKIDNSVKLPNFRMQNLDLFEKIKTFFTTEAYDIAKSIGLIHKMGILLYGKQGCGKTTFSYQVADYFIKNKNAIAVTIGNLEHMRFVIRMVKAIQQEIGFSQPIVIIYDECEYVMRHYESEIKTILDSTTSLDNCLILFSTNYISAIPDAIKDRPSRIKYCEEISSEDDETKIYGILKDLNNMVEEHMQLPDDKLRGFVVDIMKIEEPTVDHIKHKFLDESIDHNRALSTHLQTLTHEKD